MKYAAKVDENQARIVQALRKVGCRVRDTSRVGGGFPDLLVNRAGMLYLLEIKREGPPSAGRNRRTQQQIDFHRDYPVSVVTTETEALEAVGLIGEQP